MRRVLFLTAALASLALTTGAAAPQSPQALRVLFIGNSLTSTNNLPSYVAALARATGDTSFSYRMVAPPAVSLEDHWRIPRTRRALATERWDAVVLQQGPSTEPAARAHLCEWTNRFADLIRPKHAAPYLFGVWSAGRFGIGEAVDSYAAAARAANVPVLPAGAAWADAWRLKPSLRLHARDGLHPSRLGTYLAAVVVYAGLRNVSPTTLPRTLKIGKTRVTVPAATAALLREAAASALAAPLPAAECQPPPPRAAELMR